ncbi:MAG TPA: Glu/Leu/Phe/Val dehydrogenase dimerization domain-containing protein [Conexibacter sp.]|nr:Glu/Leu/Phe/Val dehydrogenase dimerization domain-containing protein [Conexibacter sp.]
MVAIHSTARGPSLGGCRMWSYADVRAATLDVLRLSRAMTYKAACAGLPLGGGKGVIALPPGTRLTGARRREALLDFGDAVQTLGGRYLTAEDVGIGSRDMPVVAERTSFVTGLATARGGSGDPSPFTAIGVEAAIRTVCARLFGSPSLEGRSVAVLGLGHVGSRVARLCARGGAQLVLSDVDPAKRALAERLGARWTTPGRALSANVDVLSPCALGAVFTSETIPKLRCRAIAGAANNQLADERVADLLRARGILWAPDYVVNAGGIVNIAVELRPEGYDAAVARRDCRAIGRTLAQVLDAADAAGVTPLAAANALAERRLARPERQRAGAQAI